MVIGFRLLHPRRCKGLPAIDAYLAPRSEDNELFSQFKYAELKGFDYSGGYGTITRRDPSKVIFRDGKYYVWYTHWNMPLPPQGPENSSDILHARDWDLREIWYATSEDGLVWEEQGVAIPRQTYLNPGWLKVSNT